MAYPRVVSWLTTSCANASTKKAILKQLPPLACGSINGAPSSFAYWSMTLESSILGRNPLFTSRQLYCNTTKSQKIGRVKNSPVLTLNGSMWTHTKSALAACSSRITSVTYYFEWDTKCPRKKQLLSHKHRKIVYGAKQQYAHVKGSSPSLDEKGVQQVQAIGCHPILSTALP